ncbi:MAG: hypothetical protein NC033_00365 [Clostridiales bacterium]|nr:hypothetical protein [Clostridiales bacterium]
MNKFRKILIGFTVAAGAACLCGAGAACNTSEGGNQGSVPEVQPDYYQLDLTGGVGADIVFQGDLAQPDNSGETFRFGGKVKEGVEVRFTVLVGNHATGTPQVSLNNSPLLSDGGVYSFIMEQDSTVSITGLSALYSLSFLRTEEVTNTDGQQYLEERRIAYYDENGEEIVDDVMVVGATDYKFKLWVSPYYTDDYTVSCGFDVLTPDGDGFYTVSEVGADGEISVDNLTMADSFATVGDGTTGDGSADNPFKISTPVDLYYLAALVNDDYYGGRFAGYHYKLMNDIDMKGEQLYVIGDNSTEVAAFSGTFDGNGHTIKNFSITDEVYDQSTYAQEYLPYVGLFGYAVATVNSNNTIIPAVIKNVTLADYTVEVHPASAGAGAYAGSLLGYGIGAEVSGCRAVNGTIAIANDSNQIVNAGGLIGRLQGAYGSTASGDVARSAFVRSCSTDVAIHGTGSPHSLGGIAGYLVSADESAIAYAVNCYSEGTVSGGMRAGGVVGTLGRYSTVSNSYSTARISANNIIEGLVYDEFRGAYAGGIAGYAEENTVIAGCYAAGGRMSASSIQGASYAFKGDFVGGFATPDAGEADYSALIGYGNQQNVASPTAGTFTALGWSESEWDFGGALPVLKVKAADGSDPLATARQITVRIFNGASQFESATVAGYMPMADWYGSKGGVPEYAVNAQGRSWGYYFDSAMTQRVPYGFVPVKDETTIYVGFADYNAVAGTYYLQDTAFSNGASITLTADGKAQVRSGGLYHECPYIYNGKQSDNIILYRSCLAALTYGEDEINGTYFAYGGTAANGELKLSSYLTLVNTESTSEYVTYNNPTDTVTALKPHDNFVYGEYKNENGVFYTFRTNGTGVRTAGTTTESFTFAPADGGGYTVKLGGRSETVTVNGDGTVDRVNGVSVSRIDEFKGSWKKSANSAYTFTFDGEGSVAINGGTAVTVTPAGAGVIGFEIDGETYKASFSGGILVINGENYYVSDNFTGEWYMLGTTEQIMLSFGGVGTAGYGSATINYAGGRSQTLDAEYDLYTTADGTHLRVFVGDRQYGELTYDASSNTASSAFYSLLYDEYRRFEFNIYDVFRGVWTGVDDKFDTVTFNGRSSGDNGAEVVARSALGATLRGAYTLTDSVNGTMTVGGIKYNIVYNEKENRVSFTEDREQEPASGLLGRRDDWYGVVLYDGETSYTFDGKSNVGKPDVTGAVKVSGGEPIEYTVNANGEVVLGGYKLTASGSGFGWNGKTLVFKTGFKGSWYVSATDAPVEVSEVDGNFTATVGGESYVYNPLAKTLTRTDDDTVTVLSLLSGNDEMNMMRTTADGTSYVYCIRTENSDSWRGEYKATDGSGWKFDGLGSCIYGSGTAIFTPASGDPVNYSYRINEIGKPYIVADSNLMMVDATSGEAGAFQNGGNWYKTVAVDTYYGRVAVIQGNQNTFFFDGNNTVWVKSAAETVYTRKAYSYEIVTSVLCELTDSLGVRLNGRIASSGRNYRLTVTPQIQASIGYTVYSFGWRTLWRVSGNDYYAAYTFVATNEKNGQYELTDADGNVFSATLTKSEEGNTLTMTPKEVISVTMHAQTYVFAEGGSVYLMGESDGYVKAYTYKTVDAAKGVYELTDIMTKTVYTATVTTDETTKEKSMTLTPKQEESKEPAEGGEEGADGQE